MHTHSTHLHEECTSPLNNINNIHVCLILAGVHTEMLNIDLPSSQKMLLNSIDEDVETTKKTFESIVNGLESFKLKSDGFNDKSKYSNTALLAHIVACHSIAVGKEGKERYEGSAHLNFCIDDHKLKCIKPTEKDLQRGQLIRDDIGDGAKKKVEKWKLITNLLGIAMWYILRKLLPTLRMSGSS